ncbi:MAG TPA: TonB-dependent receptor [Bryobacteraceae bacterium]|nr:TonB-dependent receptor [Bryobacteraceae bacterium]
MHRYICLAILVCQTAWLNAAIVTTVTGVLHDPTHRPVGGAQVVLHAASSDYSQKATSAEDGSFQFSTVPVGDYVVTAEHEGFQAIEHALTVSSSAAPVLHLQFELAGRRDSADVKESAEVVNSVSVTPTTMIGRAEIANTPGGDLTNSMAAITDHVPGAYMTHDQLHVRGGHQVTWAIDGIPIPNTNIASNVGPQIDPKDMDYLEVQRGGFSAEYGDRTYGVFNVVPRTGFERNGDFELNSTFGSFNQTNNQMSWGDHTARMAYFASIDGNRSDYGLETPGPEVMHDRVWGLGGFGSFIYNVNASNQLRVVASVRRDDYEVPSNGLERERDSLASFTWVHTWSPGVLLTVSPFYHYNEANYDSSGDSDVSLQHRESQYGGAQVALNAVTSRHDARVGVYGFGQHDNELSEVGDFHQQQISTGHLEAGFLEDQYKPWPWLTLTAGLRLTHFSGAVSENAASPRVGAAIRIPWLKWVLRGFYGRYYQAPPLSTVSGSLLDLATSQGLGFIPLRGERDEENQVGLTIPLKGWSFDVNSFRIRARNYFDHNAIGDSNVFYPLSIAGARIYGWEFTLRSPRILRRLQADIAYSYQHAEAEGAITGGLTDFSPPDNGYFLLDHDQRHTLNGGFHATLPWQSWVSGHAYYGSGFTDGSSDVPRHLEAHTTFDFSVGKAFGERVSISVNGLNVTNRRFLLDNSETFGGTHYAEPRQIYMQVRYRFHF